MKKYSFVLLMLLAFSLLVAENDLILEIEISGNQNIEKELIRSLILLEVGDIITTDDVSKSINNLYQLGVFEDIQIEKNELPQGLSLQVIVKEFPIVNSIEISGNKKLSESKIMEVINLKKGSYWSPFLKSEVKNAISEQYKKKGFHLVVMDFRAIDLDQNKVDLFIDIDEGTKVAIKKIKIHGNKKVTAKKLLGKMKTKKASLLRSGKFNKEKFNEDLENIITYYNKKGFIDARIISWEKKLVEDKFLIDIYLYEGNQFYFGKVLVAGNERFTDELITSQFKFKDDEVFNLEKFNKQLSSIASMYYEEGYIYAIFDHELQKSAEKINIQLNIRENTRARVRKINIKGNRKTKEKVIRRHLVIAPGDYFQQSKIMKSQQNIYNMGFFEPDIYLDNPKIINQNGDIDLVINLNDKISGTANGGIAVNSQDGIVGQLAVTHNNLFGNSWQSGVKWEFGGKIQNFSFNFTNPYFMDTSTLVGFDIYLTTKEWSTYEVRTKGGSIRLGHPLGFINYSKLIGGYSFYSKKYSILKGDEEDASETLKELDEKGWQNTSSFSLTFSRDSRDNIFFPTSGSFFTLYSELAGGLLQGDFNYFKQIAQVSWFTKTIWELSLKTKWRFGYVAGYGGEEAPPDERFYLGGTGPDGIRGYPDRSIGPHEGGLREIIFSAEYGAPIAGDLIVGLLFFDAGNCYYNLEDFNFWEIKTGAGVGIRVRSPFGLIGFDYAHNFETRRWEPHFQFGTTF
ncbi:MAG: outer membrane protein assembly factor BamA [Candidatus Cloacimonetes bacterium]|nr:outer membrane protein assembly factor BamA [Candidatus Cloacimonadota bacterium]